VKTRRFSQGRALKERRRGGEWVCTVDGRITRSARSPAPIQGATFCARRSVYMSPRAALAKARPALGWLLRAVGAAEAFSGVVNIPFAVLGTLAAHGPMASATGEPRTPTTKASWANGPQESAQGAARNEQALGF